MPIIKANSINMYYESYGQGEPLVLIKEYIDNMAQGAQDLGSTHAVEPEIVKTIIQRTDALRTLSATHLELIASFNVAIAIEHIALRALDYRLGTCWVKLVDTDKIRGLFDWNQNMCVVALLPIGYPNENPAPRKRKTLSEIII